MNKVIEKEIDAVIDEEFANIYSGEFVIQNAIKYYETCSEIKGQIGQLCPEFKDRGLELYLANIQTNKSIIKYVIKEILKKLLCD